MMENSNYENRENKINNNISVNLIMDESCKKPVKRRKKKDCKYCRNKGIENAQKHLAIISIPIDNDNDSNINEESTNNNINKQQIICRDELHNQQIIPVLNGILSDEKIILNSTEKYWPQMMKTNSIYSDNRNQRKIKNNHLTDNIPVNIKKNNKHWQKNFAYKLNITRDCNIIKFIIIIALLSLLAIGAVALYILFEPEKVQIIKQYFHLSKGINDSFVNHTDQPQRLIANINRLENSTALLSNPNFNILTTQKIINNKSETKSTINIYKKEKVVATMLNSIAIRYCNNCYSGEICVALADENIPTCKIAININDSTGCGGMCSSIDEKCQQVDKNIFRCVKMVHQCLDDEWTCSNALCIPLVKLCDGHMNCYDHSDEYNCDCNLQTHFQCGKNTSCLPLEQRCDACLSKNEFTCNNGECILKTRFCDGFKDCTDGSDEPYGCHGRCNKNEFTCLNKRCVARNFKCNGVDDCGDGSDELYCKN